MIGLKRITPLNSEYRRRFIATISFVALTISFSATSAAAQSEDQIKAAFLFNFARYVEWPTGAFESSDAALRICMVGSGDFASIVSETVSGKNVGDRAVEVDTSSDLFGAAGCHILYVGESVSGGPAEVAASVRSLNVFTVADRAGFAAGGGIANFIRTDNKVRFEINPGAAKKAGLKISDLSSHAEVLEQEIGRFRF